LRSRIVKQPQGTSQNSEKRAEASLSKGKFVVERGKNSFFGRHKLSFFMIAMVAVILASVFLAPVFSISDNPCSSCHGGQYSQYLDILEGNSANQLPASVGVGQTATVTVVVENILNDDGSGRYSELSSVSLTLTSANGHFIVASPTSNIGSMQPGTATASWQITGYSVGSDSLIIQASAVNTHINLEFSDNYSPAPAITVFATGLPPPTTPSPTPTPTPSPIPTPTPIETPTSTQAATAAPTPSPITPIETSTSTPAPTATSSLQKIQATSPTASPSPTTTQSAHPTTPTYLIATIVVIAIAIAALIVAKVAFSHHSRARSNQTNRINVVQ
jgi:hypothetical protein